MANQFISENLFLKNKGSFDSFLVLQSAIEKNWIFVFIGEDQ